MSSALWVDKIEYVSVCIAVHSRWLTVFQTEPLD
jgi:hypothetical protein